MSEDLQSLLERINREGVAKAEAEAAKILTDAKAKAAEIVKAANEESAKAKADAERASADYAERAAETVRQAERDTVLKIRAAVTSLLEKLLTETVNRTLSDGKNVAALVTEAVRGLVGTAEVAVNPQLAAALKAELAAQREITVVTDEAMNTGFSVRLEGGRVEHAFTAEVIAAELAKRLRPDLAKLLD